METSSQDERVQNFDRMITLSQLLATEIPDEKKASTLAQYAQVSRTFEDIAIHSALQSIFGYISFQTAKKCLDIYWSWVNPTNYIIYRPAFFRDMASYSSTNAFSPDCCYSPALLSTIFTITIPLLYGKDDELGKIVEQHSETLITHEMFAQAHLASVATFIHRSIKAMQENHASNIWIFSGIAYRFAEDLDLFSMPQDLDQILTIQDVEARSRLAWALFYWDKVFSIYLGRLPSITQEPFSVSDFILDDSQDLDAWHPVIEFKSDNTLLNEIHKIFDRANQHSLYKLSFAGLSNGKQAVSPSSTNLFLTSSMRLNCKLLGLLNSIISDLYGTRTATFTAGKFTFGSASQKNFKGAKSHLVELKRLWEQVPNDLKMSHTTGSAMDGKHNPAVIVNNLIYHTCALAILAPINRSDESLDEGEILFGLSAVEKVLQIVVFYASNFGRFYPNYWLEFAPFAAAEFLLSLLDCNSVAEKREEVLCYSEAMLKVLQRPLFQTSGLVQTRLELSKYVKECDSPRSASLGEKPHQNSVEFPVDPVLQVTKSFEPSPMASAHASQMPFQQNGLPIQNARSHFIMQPSRPHDEMQTVLAITQDAMVSSYPSTSSFQQRPMYMPHMVAGLHGQYTTIGVPHIPERPMNPNSQYTFSSRMTGMPETGPSFNDYAGHFAGIQAGVGTESADRSHFSSREENHLHSNRPFMMGADEVQNQMVWQPESQIQVTHAPTHEGT